MQHEMTRKVFIKTYGCQMNVYDSERIHGLLAEEGYGAAADINEADLVILNTCHIREKAAEKVYSELGRIRRLKERRQRNGRELLIAVAGCVAQAEGEEIVRRAPAVDLVFGPQAYHRLPGLIARRKVEGSAIVETEFAAAGKFERMAAGGPGQAVTAFLTVQEGCDKFCTFCVVPYTRGAEYSRPVSEIESEARQLAAAGVREVTLLGQNVNAYHGKSPDGDTWTLARLITHLSQIDGIERWRYTTSHPREMDDALIEAHAVNPKLMPYLHLPVQAGSNRILKAMNRGHTAEQYLRTIERIRRARSDIALSGDFIVGFPGESEQDFQDTLAMAEEVGYASAYSFKYSPRPGTPAAARGDQVADEVKADRLKRLQELLARKARKFNEACIGRTLPILLDRPGRESGQIAGRSPYLQAVHMTADGLAMGQIVDATIDSVGPNSLSAHIRQAA
jgi:tRNA-2-methylthio-N6-dimethylallyladenosine synthase